MSNLLHRSAALLAALVALSACGGPAGETGKSDVATLASGAPKATASTATADSGRPQLRLDMTDEDEQRLWTTYDDCLVAHGVKTTSINQPGPAGLGRRLDQSGEPKSAYRACANKLPLQPPELDQDKNPNYAQQWNDNVRCLRRNGLMVHVTKPGEWTWDNADNPVPDNEAEIEKSCTLEAFGGKK